MLTINHLSHSFGEKELFSNVSFSVNHGQRIGIIGPNGTGKSTLLKIIDGQIYPNAGSVEYSHENIVYLEQDLTREDLTIDQYLGEFPENRKKAVMAQVDLGSLSVDHSIQRLSGGQQMRLRLARVLLAKPSVLLLDEPTNNLDTQAIAWLIEFVKKFRGAILVVSHDRYFLDEIATHVLAYNEDKQTFKMYVGNYTKFEEDRATEAEHQARIFEVHERKRKKMELWIADKKQQLAVHQSTSQARLLESMKKRYEREIVARTPDAPWEETIIKKKELKVTHDHSKRIWQLENMYVPGLFVAADLEIRSKDRVLLKGANGVGKTTLINILRGLPIDHKGLVKHNPDAQLYYFLQNHDSIDREQTVLDQFLDAVKGSAEEARAKIATFGFGSLEIDKKVSELSPGQRARLIIAILQSKKWDFIVLDEPTNHVDMTIISYLERVLKDYEGGFLIVSHDRRFVEQIGITRIIEIIGGELVERYF